MRGKRRAIYLEEAEILEHTTHAANQYILRVAAPAAANAAQPGTFAHLTCDPSQPMRRPLSIMRADRSRGWLEFLYKPVGAGLAKLGRRRVRRYPAARVSRRGIAQPCRLHSRGPHGIGDSVPVRAPIVRARRGIERPGRFPWLSGSRAMGEFVPAPRATRGHRG